MADDYFIYTCVSTALTGVFIKPLFIIWIIFLCLAPRRKDHARVGVTYLKAVMPFEVAALVFYVISLVVYLVYYHSDYYYYSSDSTVTALMQTGTRTSIIGGLFERIADILLIMTFVEYGNGFFYILTQQRTTLQRVLRYVALASGLVIFALSIAQFGMLNAAYTSYYKSREQDDSDYSSSYYDSYSDYLTGLRTSQRLVSAINILLFLISLPLFAYAVVVVVKTRYNQAIKNSAVLLLVASILNAIRRLWGLIYVATWLLQNKYAPLALDIIDPIFNVWIFFVVLVLLYVIGVRKAKGLWTTPQPWMGGAAPPALTGQPLPQMNHWGQYPQQVVFVQPAPAYMPQGQPGQPWQGQPQMPPQQGGYYYAQGPPQQPLQQQPTGTHGGQSVELPQSHVANGFHPHQEVKP